MAKITEEIREFSSPSRYYQGAGLVYRLPEFSERFGKKVFAVIDVFFYDDLSKKLSEAYEKDGAEFKAYCFEGEITQDLINSVTESVKDYAPDVIVGIGGGKSMDTAKAVADNLEVATIIVPTTASTDAPTIAVSVLYNADGTPDTFKFYKKNPDIVLADSRIIADAPVRFLVSGMGDALATYFEGMANKAFDGGNYEGLRRTALANTIAEYCYEMLLEKGEEALYAARKHVLTEALEDIIEANILLSGLGVENTGIAGAHSLCEGISELPEGCHTLHGEKVGYGVLVQLVVENGPKDLLQEVLEFCASVGLPITLSDLQVPNTPENIWKIAEGSMHAHWCDEPLLVTTEKVAAAIVTVDAMGTDYREKYGIPDALCKGK